MKFKKNQTLDFTSKLSDFEIVNQEFIRCKCYMLAVGDNVNGSDITLESVKKAMARDEFYNKPIVAHLYKDEDTGKWRVGGHDSKWIITNTSIEIVNECIPFGTIPESSDLKLEEVLEPDGETVNTYLTCQIILWTGRFNIMDAAYSDDIYFNQSCELSVNEYHWKNNDILAIDDFTFSALCLLNKSDDKSKNVRPCFPSCRVEKIKAFSIDTDKFKQNFELMLEKLKQYESDGTSTTTTTVQNNGTNSNQKMKGEPKMDFAKITESLSAAKCNEDGNICKYRLLNATDSKVYALDMEDYKPYSFDYASAKDDESEKEYIVIDFESKDEMSLSATDKITDKSFKEFSIKDEINAAVGKFEKENEAVVNVKIESVTKEISEKFQKEYDELKKNYEDLVKASNILQGKVDTYEKKENDAKVEQHKNDINSLVDGYADKLGKYSAYLVYKANIEKQYEKSKEQVEQDLILMAGKYLTSKEGSFNKKFSYTPIEAGVVNNTKNPITSRYGHLLDKYIK